MLWLKKIWTDFLFSVQGPYAVAYHRISHFRNNSNGREKNCHFFFSSPYRFTLCQHCFTHKFAWPMSKIPLYTLRAHILPSVGITFFARSCRSKSKAAEIQNNTIKYVHQYKSYAIVIDNNRFLYNLYVSIGKRVTPSKPMWTRIHILKTLYL